MPSAYAAAQKPMQEFAQDESVRTGAADSRAGASRGRFQRHLDSGQGALDSFTQGAMSRAMPGLMKMMQGLGERNNRRGISGPLASSYEGDLMSAFQQNIADATAGEATRMYGMQAQGYGNMYGTDTGVAESSRNRYGDILAGNRDAEFAMENAKQERKKSLWGSILGTVGTVAGTALAGPVGGAVANRVTKKFI